jgi:hypothetical protein
MLHFVGYSDVVRIKVFYKYGPKGSRAYRSAKVKVLILFYGVRAKNVLLIITCWRGI